MHHPCITSWRYALATRPSWIGCCIISPTMVSYLAGQKGQPPERHGGRSQVDILSTSFSYPMQSLQPCQVHASIPTLQMATVARGSWSQNSNLGHLNPELFLCKGLQGRKDGQAHIASQASSSQDPELPLSPPSLPWTEKLAKSKMSKNIKNLTTN